MAELYARSWRVDVTLIDEWLAALNDDDYDQVLAALELLKSYGPQLGRPIVDTIVGSRHKNMKELRPGSSGRSELRILFAFDPTRRAIMLVAGDKQGAWADWYRSAVPIADGRLDEHIARIAKRRRP